MNREDKLKELISSYKLNKRPNDIITIGKLKAELRGIQEERERIKKELFEYLNDELGINDRTSSFRLKDISVKVFKEV